MTRGETVAKALARGLALELAPRRVNTVAPGTTETRLLARTSGEGRDAYVASPKEKFRPHHLDTAAEVGAAILFLMNNVFMNDGTLHIDGGSRRV